WSGRVGFRHAFAPNSVTIASYSTARADGTLDIESAVNIDTDEDAQFLEVQHLFRSARFGAIGGYGRFRGTTDETTIFGPLPPDRNVADVHHDNAYGYVTIVAPRAATVTVGLSAESLTDVFVETTQVNPKLGVSWKPAGRVTLRGAAFRALKRTLIGSQTIEPTHVAGFNQFFDDISGTDAWRYGAGVDLTASPRDEGSGGSSLYVGAEVSRRDLQVPVGFLGQPGAVSTLDHAESLARSYAYWTPHRSVAVKAEYFFERFIRDDEMDADGLARSTAHRVPVELSVYHPSGVFVRPRITYAHQRGRFLNAQLQEIVEGDSSFWIFDLSAGYRFPKRWGMLNAQLLNAFDADVVFQESNPTNSLLSRRRAVFAGLTLPIW
ncbi:MAG: TonB-dependent receptor, partial [Burkholderiales bacterium]